METTEQMISLKQMHDYLSEWAIDKNTIIHSLTFDENDSFKRIYRIYISKMTEEPAFEQVMDIATPISFSTIVSTASIKETELRGLIEKCIMLDKQIEDAKKPTTIEVVQPQNQ